MTDAEKRLISLAQAHLHEVALQIYSALNTVNNHDGRHPGEALEIAQKRLAEATADLLAVNPRVTP